jgi:hypothetical protein
VGPGNRQDVPADEDVLGQPLRPGNEALAAVEDSLHQRVAARHHVAYHPEVGAQRHLLGAEALGESDAERGELFAHRRVDVGVAAGDAVAGRLGDGRQAAHESAADSENVEMDRHAGKGGILFDALRYDLKGKSATRWVARTTGR